MSMIRRVAWAAVLVGSGVPSAQGPGSQPAPPPAVEPHASRPAQSPPQDDRQPATSWPLELDDDEFEGEGWSFWPLWRY
jgi:hypothetical protein